MQEFAHHALAGHGMIGQMSCWLSATKKASGASFRSVYSRMEWDKPSPTVTTQAHNFGTGRFGHPDQDRAITLREAAMLQGFPKKYAFVKPGSPVELTNLGRLIGNAVPPLLGQVIGSQIVNQVALLESEMPDE